MWGSGKGPSLAALRLYLRGADYWGADYWIGRYKSERCEAVSEWGERDLWATPSKSPSWDRQLSGKSDSWWLTDVLSQSQISQILSSTEEHVPGEQV